ncbi:hypothetical protein EUX98_g7273 [Antrodiella citrinella]|uniref:U6 small nuclear RNA (adenine-(43)-N(6))-methyltransferase n=1 Tax=Antrodiella citrinella TaxID=2447956 RepID=A0A4S4MUB6_9APHY|nr:hypothetical protein EUX98_g7273 [Antrodiella citrinella]
MVFNDPSQLNYVLWLEDILHVTNIAYGLQEAPVVGIDIGTGASAIYPMLGCRKNVHWRFVATELDSSSIEHASANIQANALQDKIALVTYDFTMCNPPFYESRDEVLRSAEAKEVGPNAVCTGADVEMISPGGESAFVSQMVRESIRSGTRCRWYTSMLGKLSSLFAVVKVLNEHEIDNYAITEFVQGQTRRWAIAWSFTNIHLPESIARVANSSLQNIMPKRNTLQRSFKNSRRRPFDILQDVTTSIDGVSSRSTSLIAGEDSVADFVVYASGNTWSRAARRRKQTATAGDDPMHAEDELSQLIGCEATIDFFLKALRIMCGGR